MEKPITFNGKEYTTEIVTAMSMNELLELRNLIATNLGVSTVKSFPDQDKAVSGTLKALQKFQETVDDETKEAGPSVKPAKISKPKPEPKERGLAKSSEAKTVKRPTKKMFSTISKTGVHDSTTHGRAHRWDNYKDGMTIADVIEGEGTEPWDVYNWSGQGIMKVTEPTDVEFAQRKAAWYKKHNMEDPEAEKEAKEKLKAEAKVKREAEAAEKKAAAEKAKADKEAADKAAAAEKAASGADASQPI